MICPECNGKCVTKVVARTEMDICPKCGGKGEVNLTNFECVTRSPEKLAEFIVGAMVIYDGNRHIFITEAIEMAKKKNVYLDCGNICKDVVDWLKQESE